MNLNIMKDKPFIHKDNVDEIRSHKRPVPDRSWEEINRHFDKTLKHVPSRVYFLKSSMKVAAGLILLLSFTWLVFNKNVPVHPAETIVLENNMPLNPVPANTAESFQKELLEPNGGEESSSNSTVASVPDVESKSITRAPGLEEPLSANKADETVTRDNHREAIEQQFAGKRSKTEIAGTTAPDINPLIAEKDKEKRKHNTDKKRERDPVAVASIETRIPGVSFPAVQEADLNKFVRETEIPDSYFDGASTGAIVGYSLISLISENEIFSDLNNKFQKIKNLEVIQINW